MTDACTACGKCCNRHWLLKLTNKREIMMFGNDVVYGNFIWTDKCKFLIDNKCSIHDDGQPYKCKKYFCEGNLK